MSVPAPAKKWWGSRGHSSRIVISYWRLGFLALEIPPPSPAGIHSIPSVRLLLRDQLAPIMIEKARLAQEPREALAVDDR